MGGGRIEAGTGFVGIEVMVSTDLCFREHYVKGTEEEVQGDHLLGGAVVAEDPPIPP